MPRPKKGTAPAGSTRFRNGKWYGRVTLEGDNRPTFELPTCTSDEDARTRTAVLSDVANKLRAANALDLADATLRKAARADASELADVLRVVAALGAGSAVRKTTPEGMTFKALATKWTSGELAKLYPDHVKVKRTVDDDVSRFEKHVYTLVADVPIAAFRIEHAQRVMAALPPTLARNTRRNVAVLLHRVLELAVFPMQLIERNPLPRGWLPKPGTQKAKPYLYPREDAQLLECVAIPFRRRFAYGFLGREGPRKSEPSGARLDLEHGAISLDENKTDDPRTWALDPGVAEALRRVRDTYGVAEVTAILDEMAKLRADQFREDLETAGIKRPELFERSATREPIKVHALRGTFVTLSLANGRSETWVADRTGHKSSAMINRYRQAARSVAELGLGGLRSLADALPELRNRRRIGASSDKRTWTRQTKQAIQQTKALVAQRIEQRFPNSDDEQAASQLVADAEPPTTTSDESSTLAPIPEQLASVSDPVEAALAAALERASAAGQWQAVETLARELEARRKAHSAGNVVGIEHGRARRRGK